MYKLISVVKKQPRLSPEEFWDLWRGDHAAHVLAQPWVKHYRINSVIHRPGRAASFDGVAEIWVESLEDLRALQAARLEGPLAESRARTTVADQTRTIVTRERVVVPEPAPGTAAVKICMIVNRRPDFSVEEFDRYWVEQHGPLVAKIPGLAGYVQNPALREPGLPQADDGQVMVWLDTLANARASATAPEYAAVLADEQKFLSTSPGDRAVVQEHRFR